VAVEASGSPGGGGGSEWNAASARGSKARAHKSARYGDSRLPPRVHRKESSKRARQRCMLLRVRSRAKCVQAV